MTPGHFIVLGIGRYGSGAYSACCLALRGQRVLLVDSAPLSTFPAGLLDVARAHGVALVGGGNPEWIMEGAAGLLVAPSIDPEHPFVRAARQRSIPVCLDMDLLSASCDGPLFYVTGSNGKSTTASWLHHMLKKAGWSAVLAGNIGVPAGKVLLALGRIEGPLVLEVSSFQGRYLTENRTGCDCLVVTNFSPNHLDHHPSLEDYRSSKRGLVPLARRAVVLNAGDPEVASWAEDSLSPVFFFGESIRRPGVFVEKEDIFWRPAEGDKERVAAIAEVSFRGRHNLHNFMAAACAALATGAPIESVRQAAGDFPGMPHRLERVGATQGVVFYNDSASTCPESTMAAVRAFDAQAVLIVGGKNKGFDILPLARELQSTAGLVLMGETAPAFNELLDNRADVAGDMEEAVRIALAKAREAGGVPVVLSPGFASFDMFEDYRARGEAFRRAVAGISVHQT